MVRTLGTVPKSRTSDFVNSFGVPPMPSRAHGFEAMQRSNFVERFNAIGLEAELSRSPKIDRARRNALKAGTLMGAFVAASALHWQDGCPRQRQWQQRQWQRRLWRRSADQRMRRQRE